MGLTWNAVQAAYVSDSQEHLARAQALDLNCPLDVFEQLFADHHEEPEFAELLTFGDWTGLNGRKRAYPSSR